MKNFRIFVDVTNVHGTQSFIVKAKNKEEAKRIWDESPSKCEFEEEEIDVQDTEFSHVEEAE